MTEQKPSKSSTHDPAPSSQAAVAPGEPARTPAEDAILRYEAIKKALEGSAPRWTLPQPDPRTDFGRVEAAPA